MKERLGGMYDGHLEQRKLSDIQLGEADGIIIVDGNRVPVDYVVREEC